MRFLKSIYDRFKKKPKEYIPPEGYIEVTGMPDMIEIARQAAAKPLGWKPERLFMEKDMFWQYYGCKPDPFVGALQKAADKTISELQRTEYSGEPTTCHPREDL